MRKGLLGFFVAGFFSNVQSELHKTVFVAITLVILSAATEETFASSLQWDHTVSYSTWQPSAVLSSP